MSVSRCVLVVSRSVSRTFIRPVCIRVCSTVLSEGDQRRYEPRPLRRYCSSVAPQSKNMYTVEERGALGSPDYRLFFKDASGPISPLHDIPLWADKDKGILNMVVEVPRWTNAKMEICLDEPLNPIKQDVKKGEPRYVANVFPHHGYIWNYGALPQTWENPEHVDPATQARGDNDPIDVIEIGQRVAARGDVVQVRVLGTLALVDEGETDWKLIAIDVRDPLAARLQDVRDVEEACPGLLKATVEWFRSYKVPDGKPVNEFAFGGAAKDAAFARRVIDETHEFWRGLVAAGGRAGISAAAVAAGGPARVERSSAAAALSAAPPRAAPLPTPARVSKVHYLASL